MSEQEMDFKTYQQKYVGFLKAMTKTRMLGILSREIFSEYPEKLPKKYQTQMYQETLYMKDKQVPKPEKRSVYIRHTVLLHYLEMLNINFIHKIEQDKHKEFLATNPKITEIYNEESLEDFPDTSISFDEFNELLQSESIIIQNLRSKSAKKERLQKAWMFDQWLYYQEVIIAMSLLESFLRESYDIFVETYPDIKDGIPRSKNSDEICFSKLLSYFMNEELKLVQRFGPKNYQTLIEFWMQRCAITHNNGVFNKKSLIKDKEKKFTVGNQVIIDNEKLDKLYSIIGNLQRIIYKKIRSHNEKS